MEEKLCRKCDLIKNLDESPNRKNSQDGKPNKCKECTNTYKRNNYQKVSVKIEYNILNELNKILRNTRKSSHIYKYIGCCPESLKLWFENQFREKICWNNYGTYWEIDHVFAKSLYDVEHNPQLVYVVNHWTNLEPLEKFKNQSKANNRDKEMELKQDIKLFYFGQFLDEGNNYLYL